MSGPERIQRRRTKGWRMPPNTVSVTRPSAFGNPFTLADSPSRTHWTGTVRGSTRPVHAFISWVESPGSPWHFLDGVQQRNRILAGIGALVGKNLACWCPLDAPCHADYLLKIAAFSTGRCGSCETGEPGVQLDRFCDPICASCVDRLAQSGRTP